MSYYRLKFEKNKNSQEIFMKHKWVPASRNAKISWEKTQKNGEKLPEEPRKEPFCYTWCRVFSIEILRKKREKNAKKGAILKIRFLAS